MIRCQSIGSNILTRHPLVILPSSVTIDRAARFVLTASQRASPRAWKKPCTAGVRANCTPRVFSTNASGSSETVAERNKRVALYMISIALATLGVSYASVPLYKVFCQVTGFGGTTQRVDIVETRDLTPAEDGRVLKITFSADVSDTMPWKFKPQQNNVKVAPGETALAFYKATNNTSHAITGVATYNVYPPKAGLYFNKIQCFCFEEQRLRPGEEIDMPVFFFIDKDIMNDPAMDHVNNITLSYTFFKTGEDE